MADVIELLTELISLDPANHDAHGVETVLAKFRTLSNRIAVIRSSWVTRAAALAEQGSGPDSETAVGKATRASTRHAKQDASRSKLLDEQPDVADAFVNGDIGAEYLDIIANALLRVPENQRAQFDQKMIGLIEYARNYPLDAFRRHVNNIVEQLVADGVSLVERQRERTSAGMWIDPLTGMYHLRAHYDPETGEPLFAAINAEIAAIRTATGDLSPERRTALAIANLINSAHRGIRPDNIDIVVLVDADTLCNGTHDDTVCEYSSGTQLPTDTARRMWCNATTIYTATVGSERQLLNLARSARQANRAQRRALRTQYTTSAFDQCTVGFDRCEIHHVDPYEHGGPTDLANLIPLCSRHHHLVHEGNWRLTIDTARTITITRPDGQQTTRTPHTPAYQPQRHRQRARRPVSLS